MTLDLSNSAIDRVRLRLGDTTCPYILDDQTIEYYLSKNANNENRTYRELLTVVLFSLSRLTRERAGDLEIFGSEHFRQYFDAVKLALSNPELNYIVAMPFAGGISRNNMATNQQDTDSVDKPFYMGFTDETPSYLNKTVFVPSESEL
jgi:hypothetical protein